MRNRGRSLSGGRGAEACHDAAVTNVLVTGGAGFIGSHLCERLLAEGKRVVAVDDLSSGHIANLAESRGYGKRFAFHHMDVRAPGLARLFQAQEPEVVYHLAARREDAANFDAMADASISVMGLLNVFEATAAARARKIVIASTAAIYGDARRFPIKETAAAGARPLTPGAISRRVAGDYARFYERFGGLDHTILVPGSVYGPREVASSGASGGGGVVASLAGALVAAKQPVIHGDGNQTRDFVFIDDTVHAFALAADHGSGRVVNVGTGVETTINSLYRMLCEIVGTRGEPRYGASVAGQARRVALDPALAADSLGWKPWTHLEDGLRETVAFLRSSQTLDRTAR
jgi:UDP-glucose 4-epimerase